MNSTEFNRRQFLYQCSLGALSVALPMQGVFAQNAVQNTAQSKDSSDYRPLVIIDLKGANDGLNTFVPFNDDRYYNARPSIALKKDSLLTVNEQFALHGELKGFKTIWDAGQLSILQGVGYPSPVLSHFRSTDIWDTGSSAEQMLTTGWLTRAFAAKAVAGKPSAAAQFAQYSVDFVGVGSIDTGPAQGGARTLNLNAAQNFINQSKLAKEVKTDSPALLGALRHIAKVEHDILGAAVKINPNIEFKTEFTGSMAGSVRAAATVLVSRAAPVVSLTLGGFDTHRGQLGTHAALMSNLSQAMVALKSALSEHGLWQNTLVLTTSEFGRRFKENASNGTDHGTANVLFASGGAARGGLFGAAPNLGDLDTTQNLKHTTDFRSVYASVLQKHWAYSAAEANAVFGQAFPALGFIG